jgi:hypothetical protein
LQSSHEPDELFRAYSTTMWRCHGRVGGVGWGERAADEPRDDVRPGGDTAARPDATAAVVGVGVGVGVRGRVVR